MPSPRINREPEGFLRSVLRKIPNVDRQCVLKLWKLLGNGKPSVFVVSGDTMKILGFDAPAVTRLAEYYFRDELFQFAPDTVLEAIVAHELAHAPDSIRAFEAGVASINLPPRDPPKKDAVSRVVQQIVDRDRVYFIESRVWETVRQWGFDQSAAAKWCEGNLN